MIEDTSSINLTGVRAQWQVLGNNETSGSEKGENFFLPADRLLRLQEGLFSMEL
jgi:hypothetical protein